MREERYSSIVYNAESVEMISGEFFSEVGIFAALVQGGSVLKLEMIKNEEKR
jgi:hypothetical protein